MNPVFKTQRFCSHIVLLCLFAAMAGCSSVSDMLEPEKIDYKSAAKPGNKSKLEVPPDLSPPRANNAYSIENNRGTATASEYSARQPNVAARPAATAPDGTVAPVAVSGMRIERDGKQRWLVAKEAPEVLWPKIKDFWQESGFLIAIENPQAGLMETDWAENRAKIPQDFIRNSIGKVLDSLYSTGERDKFRTRLEPRADGGTEVYISHRGAEEKVTGQPFNQSTVWTARPSDPELEAEFLRRLMTAMGADPKVAGAAVKDAKPVSSERARISKDGSQVEIEEGFDRAWRRVGLALDRVGFTVEDRDRARGLYFVRYVDQGDDAKNKSEPGFFARMFRSKNDKSDALRYQIRVEGEDSRSKVSVQNDKGAIASDPNAKRILSLLNEQLK
ncbi:MAG: outer membrane protein assembly factor BamC [Burkholderiaceae bacterium]|jgi:outer membrane protein assembly factor BamC|nr:outer membrane protein assembly factor BamC [Oxalobacteraceae bacterium]